MYYVVTSLELKATKVRVLTETASENGRLFPNIDVFPSIKAYPNILYQQRATPDLLLYRKKKKAGGFTEILCNHPA